MNWSLLICFLSYESVVLVVYWTIARLIPQSLYQISIFMLLILIDVLATKLVFPGAFNWLWHSIFNKNDATEE